MRCMRMISNNYKVEVHDIFNLTCVDQRTGDCDPDRL